jgi:hypothetical protein
LMILLSAGNRSTRAVCTGRNARIFKSMHTSPPIRRFLGRDCFDFWLALWEKLQSEEYSALFKSLERYDSHHPLYQLINIH